jgi:hypothetical protein
MAGYARQEINAIGGYYAYSSDLINGDSIFDFDSTKLSVHTLGIGLAGIEVYDLLRDEYDIQVEFGDIGNILAYISVGDTDKNIERLVSALAEIKRLYQKDKTGMLEYEYIAPTGVLAPQEAFFAEKQSVPLEESRGRVCAEFVMAYPPGIPILAPGELITKEIYEYIRYAKEKGCFLTGTEDLTVSRINVLKGRDKVELWFSEAHTEHVRLSIRIDRQLYTGQSAFSADLYFRVAGIRAVSDPRRVYDAHRKGRVYLPQNDCPHSYGGQPRHSRHPGDRRGRRRRGPGAVPLSRRWTHRHRGDRPGGGGGMQTVSAANRLRV